MIQDTRKHALSRIILTGWWVCLFLILCFTSSAFAQVEPFSVSSPPTPVGSGARAMGMGGAFVAVADDATAASWNPGGLVQLQKPEVSVVLSAERRVERRYSLFYPEIDGEDKVSVADLNYLSLAYPFSLAGRNWVFSLNYQRLYDFCREIHFSYFGNSLEFESEGSLYTLSPAWAVQATEDLFLGATLNIWNDAWTGRSGWKNTYHNLTNGQLVKEEYNDFRGMNVNLGLLYHINPQWTLGGVFKSPFQGKFDYIYSNNLSFSDSGLFYGRIISIDLPPTYALGVSYRLSDAWSFSADVTRKDWDELVWTNDRGQSFGLFTRFDPNADPINFPRIDPTYSFRLGVEYLKIVEKTVIPIRGGIFYDPIPSAGSPHSEIGFSIGSGISLNKLILDCAYQYRFRYDVPGTETGWGYGVFQDKRQHLFLLSAIYHF